jgi:hypothetical protein
VERWKTVASRGAHPFSAQALPPGALHALAIPPPEEYCLFPPRWVRAGAAGYHDAEAVTLVVALDEAPPGIRVPMIAAHREVMLSWVEMGEDVLARTSTKAPERRGVGFALLLVASELAAAMGTKRLAHRIGPDLRVLCIEAVTRATSVAGACLATTMSEYLATVA